MTKRMLTTMHQSEGKSLVATFLLFLLASLVLYGTLTPLLSWKVFSEDDSHIMRVAIDYGWLEHYFFPDVYRQLSVANYTPLSLTVYRFMLMAFGLNPIAYLIFSVISISFVSALSGLLTEQFSKSRLTAWLVMLLIFSNLSMLTLLSRFYTIHYIAGGIFALLALIFVVRGKFVLPSVLMFFALISKEVYVVLPVLVALYAAYHRHYSLGIGAVAALVGYLALRTFILGPSFDVGASNSYFAGFWSVAPADWFNFAIWYAKSRYLILVGVFAALIMSPKRMIFFLPLALIFALPSLSVAHGILQPEMHADRLFLALDVALTITAMLALQQSGYLQRYVKPVYLIPLTALILVVHVTSGSAHKERIVSGADYKITRYILDNADSLKSKTIYVPLDFVQGDLMRVNASLGGPAFMLTQNCLAALELTREALLVFDSQGNLSTREALQTACVATDAQVSVDIPPRFANGILEWRLRSNAGFTVGVLFVDRALAVPVSEFARQLVMPAPGERYQVFAVRNTQWWFSDIGVVEILN